MEAAISANNKKYRCPSIFQWEQRATRNEFFNGHYLHPVPRATKSVELSLKQEPLREGEPERRPNISTEWFHGVDPPICCDGWLRNAQFILEHKATWFRAADAFGRREPGLWLVGSK